MSKEVTYDDFQKEFKKLFNQIKETPVDNGSQNFKERIELLRYLQTQIDSAKPNQPVKKEKDTAEVTI